MPSFTNSSPGLLHRLKRPIPLLGAMIITLVTTSCQPAQSSTTLLPTFPASINSTQHPATTPVPVIPVVEPTLAPQVTASPAATDIPKMVTPTGTLQIDYLLQETVPISTWRPPLYPTPWAPTLYDHFYFASPIAANEINIPVADYRYGGIFFENVVHTGVDIPAKKGTPVLAAGSGTVIWAGYGVYRGGVDRTDPYGLAVTIRHDFGYQNQLLFTIYGHLDQVDVAEGQHVDTGDPLGLVGETGNVTGPHLHFEVRVGENSFFTTRNPELWLVPPIGWGVVAGRMMDTGDQLISDQMLIITDPERKLNWFGRSYGKTAVNTDPYYQENLVVGNVPAGNYLLRIAYAGVYFTAPIEVQPGMVSYFTFHGYRGITIEAPPQPGVDFTPAPYDVPSP